MENLNIPSEQELVKIIMGLPPDLQKEVADFAQFLRQKKIKRGKRKLSLTWAGGLREFRDQYTSLDLQKKAMEWWGN